jgi:hypothetical protein
MERFSAEAFFAMAAYLHHAKRNAQEMVRNNQVGRTTKLPGSGTGSKVSRELEMIETHCRAVGLTVSVKAAHSLCEMRQDGTTVGDFVDALDHLQSTIMWEMEDKVFMYIPPDRAAFYNAKELFSGDVNRKFSGIQFDMVEAGNCYAAGRGTAAVFHLMRIMEVGVQELGRKLGVSLVDEKNWQNILDEVNKAVRALPKTAATIEMSQASANLYAVKVAWRNEVMHPNDTYTLEEADNLIRQVRIFMQQLANIV